MQIEFASFIPDQSGAVSVTGIEATVRIYRDRYGIPHVQAKSEHDVFFGQGFATAQDRLWQMDLDRMRAYGRAAEYLGADLISTDITMRRLQLASNVRSDYEHLDPAARAMLDAYAAGVNALIRTIETPAVEYHLLGKDPTPWQPWDSIAVHKLRHNSQGVYQQKLWRARLVLELGPDRTAKLFPDYDVGAALVIPPGELYQPGARDRTAELAAGAHDLADGSNNWALAGTRTASGQPLLAGDPHRQLDVPNIYYQSHIACPDFDAIGLTFPGVPGFPNFGHNVDVAWCLTHGMADEQDLFVEEFDSREPKRYRTNGEWLEADHDKETIRCLRGQSKEVAVWKTRHGPIIEGDPSTGRAIALQSTAISQPNDTFSAIRQMLHATSADELDESMRGWASPVQNLVFAETAGEIRYLLRGKLPIRHRRNAWLPVPGWREDYDWQGYVEFEDMPRLRNPSSGFVATANNRIVGDEIPYVSLDYAPGFRIERLLGALESHPTATNEDMKSMLRDSVSIPGQTYARLVSQGLGNVESYRKERTLLDEWDGAMDKDGVAPLIYRELRRRADAYVLAPHLGHLAAEVLTAISGGAGTHARRLSSYLARQAREQSRELLPPGSDWETVVGRAFEEAVERLRGELGDDFSLWRWGTKHHTRPDHPLAAAFPELADRLNPPAVEMSGDADSPSVSACIGADPTVVTNTSVARYVFDVSDWNTCEWIVPSGSSGHPGSPHYSDQLSLWADNQFIPMYFSWGRISAEAVTTQVLQPE